MVKVLHVTGAYPSKENPKSHIFVKLQIESLLKLGVQIDVCLLKGRSILKYVLGVGQIRGFLKRAKYDIVHAHYMYVGWTARVSSTSPLVVTFLGSDVYGKYRDNNALRKIGGFCHVFFSRLLCAVTAASIVPCTKMSKLVGTGPTVIPHGVDLSVFRPMEPERRSLSLVASTFYILFAGLRSNPVKRFALAEQAVTKLKKSYSNIELIEIDGLTQDCVASFMNAVDCLLVTSAHEAGPIVVKEALACNLPVVSVNVGDVSDILTGVDNCYVVNPFPDEIAHALECVLKSGRRSSNGRVKAEDLSLESSARRILEVYEKVLFKK